ncbi:DUF475 domain-containing protein, partial [Acinetobacter baumannii]
GIAGFGGAFLAMVGRGFFFDEDKEVHWLRGIETQLARASGIKAAEIAVLLVALYALSRLLAPAEALTFLGAGLLGIVAFIAVEAV